MASKTAILIGMTIGSMIGGYIPVMFGSSAFSYMSLIGNTLGGLAGIIVTYYIGQRFFE